MKKISTFTCENLDKQGFGYLSDEEKARFALPLRFTPVISTILILIGLVLRSPIWIGAMALVALSGALFPRAMLMDLVYNLIIRRMIAAPRLPPTPKPRRFSYILSTAFLTCSALSFHFNYPILGLVLGAMVVIGSSILSSTLWCLGSWYFRLFFGQDAVNH